VRVEVAKPEVVETVLRIEVARRLQFRNRLREQTGRGKRIAQPETIEGIGGVELDRLQILPNSVLQVADPPMPLSLIEVGRSAARTGKRSA
jgi:hypothetical protein